MMHTISLEELRTMLLGRTLVYFSYLKKNGKMRKALGTLNENFIPGNIRIKDSSIGEKENLSYYDIKKKGWRSLSTGCEIVTILE